MLLDQALLDKVSAEAKESPRLRMNFNLHESLDSKVQRLFNAMEPGTIVPIQRHQNTAETMLLVRGYSLSPESPARIIPFVIILIFYSAFHSRNSRSHHSYECSHPQNNHEMLRLSKYYPMKSPARKPKFLVVHVVPRMVC